MNWRIIAGVVLLAFLSWVGYEIGRAGSEDLIPPTVRPGQMRHASASGQRIDGRSWRLDFDTATFTPDRSQATIAHVRDGRIHRPGKPDVLIKADGVTVNFVTNDLIITGPVHLTEEEAPGRTRTFDTVGARYSSGLRELTLQHSTSITEGGTRVVVANATVNFRTGDVKLGPLEGTKSGGESS